MPSRPRDRLACLSMVLALGWLAFAAAPAFAGARAGDQPAPAPIERADAATIRGEVGEILADPRFAPRKDFLQWLGEKLTGWHLPDVSTGMGEILVWILMIWCLLTLLAILGHIGWTFAVLLGNRRRSANGMGVGARGGREHELSYEELRERARALAAKGQFRQAVGVMMTALLRFLDRAGLLRFHQSKTNGDYVRECAAAGATAEEFRRFAGAVDALVYGGAACNSVSYRGVSSQFDRILSHVRQEP